MWSKSSDNGTNHGIKIDSHRVSGSRGDSRDAIRLLCVTSLGCLRNLRLSHVDELWTAYLVVGGRFWSPHWDIQPDRARASWTPVVDGSQYRYGFGTSGFRFPQSIEPEDGVTLNKPFEPLIADL